MKVLKYLTIAFALTLGLASCNDDEGYSLDKYWLSIATVNDLEEGDNSYYLTLDDGTNLHIAAPINPYKPKTKRVFANYTILGELEGDYQYAVRLNGIQSILTKDVIYIDPANEVKQDSIGFDPIKVISMKEGGGYINIKFAYNTGGVNSHMVNLVSDKEDLSAGGSDVIKLQFRHNQNGDPEKYPADGWVCFDLAPYKAAATGNEITFEISSVDFDGSTVTKTIKYKIGA